MGMAFLATLLYQPKLPEQTCPEMAMAAKMYQPQFPTQTFHIQGNNNHIQTACLVAVLIGPRTNDLFLIRRHLRGRRGDEFETLETRVIKDTKMSDYYSCEYY
jgi:hypothetical protein